MKHLNPPPPKKSLTSQDKTGSERKQNAGAPALALARVERLPVCSFMLDWYGFVHDDFQAVEALVRPGLTEGDRSDRVATHDASTDPFVYAPQLLAHKTHQLLLVIQTAACGYVASQILF